MLPSFVRLRVGAPEPKSSDAPRADLGSLPPELRNRVAIFLSGRTLENLQSVANWCLASKNCFDEVFKTVVELCVGPPAVFPMRLDQDFYVRARKVFPEGSHPNFKLAQFNPFFWRQLLNACIKDLKELPANMVGPFLSSNDAQRFRWKTIFVKKKLYALGVRVIMSRDPALPPPGLYDMVWPDSIEENGGDPQPANDFFSGVQTTDEFTDMVKYVIDKGHIFDYMLTELFLRNVVLKGDWYASDEFAGTEVSVDGWLLLQRRLYVDEYSPRMQMLLDYGVDPSIAEFGFTPTVPDILKMVAEDHYKIQYFLSNIEFVLRNKVQIDFFDDQHAEVNQFLPPIVIFYVHLPYKLEAWENELKPDRKRPPPDIEDVAPLLRHTYHDHFRRYRDAFAVQIPAFLAHVTTPTGSNKWADFKRLLPELVKSRSNKYYTGDLYDKIVAVTL